MQASRPQTPDWAPVIPPSQRAGALAAAVAVGEAVTDPGRVAAAMRRVHAQTRFPRTARWIPHDVAQGDTGLALFCGYLDQCFPDTGWDLRAHECLIAATGELAGQQLPLSLFSGLSGLGFVAHQLRRNQARYERLMTAIDAELEPRVLELTGFIDRRCCEGEGLAVGQFDAISGLAGIGVYLLQRQSDPGMNAVLTAVLRSMVALAGNGDDDIPRWFTPTALLSDVTTRARYPQGALNCGLAHGIPGPLALMALSHSAGADVPGLRDAMSRTARWLLAHRADDEWGVNWPSMVSLPGGTIERDRPGRAAWCYGSPGVARALWLAGCALQDEDLKSSAIEAMEAVFRRPIAARQVHSPTLCHGVAGLLQITLRFANDAKLPQFEQAATELVSQLLEAFNPNALLGFCGVEPDGTLVDQAGMLDGAPGVAMALLAAATDARPTWDRMFLLA